METVFFLLSKFASVAIVPHNMLMAAAISAYVLSLRGKEKLARRILGCLSIVLLVLAFLPIHEWLLFPLENRFAAAPVLPHRVDGIIVLSGGENPPLTAAWRQPEVNGAAERDLAFLELARRYPNAKLVFAGGSGSVRQQRYKAADVAKMLFDRQGLAASRVLFERESRNTFENVAYSKSLVHPSPGERWVVITSAFHMPRSVGIFCKAGWPVLPYPVDHNTWNGNLLRIDFNLGAHLSGLEVAIKEWIGLAAYYATGKTSSLFPSACADRQL